MLQGRSPGLSSFSSPVESGGAAEEGGREGGMDLVARGW